MNTKFSDIIRRNTDLTNITANVFYTEECAEEDSEERSPETITKLSTPETMNDANIKIFPNPATDILNVQFGNAGQSSAIKIFSATGELVRTIIPGINNTLQINISSLARGLYAIQIVTANEMKSFTFIKQ